MNTTDYMVRGTAADGQVRAFAAVSTNLAEKARQIHGTSPVVTAALGRLLTGSAMMGCMMKGDKDILTVIVKGDGPMEGMTVTADSKGNVKGYPYNPLVLIPAKANGKLDVGGAVGAGTMTVVKDLGLKEPYVGQVELVNGEIAEDLTYYFAASEQVPSAVGLGVLMDKENFVKQAGGFVIQMMPGASEEVIAGIEDKLSGIQSVTQMLEAGMSPEDMISFILEGFSPEIMERTELAFSCNCSYDRMAKALISLGEKELESLAAENEPIEIKCQFCGSAYTFTPEDIAEMLKAARE
ncbi:MAG: Hsp33 family molecular chaperone HslO [Eubacterium sp.]|nr:Hsp33 family molecular chaperone HslO [Eubacterium sp.]